MAQIPFNQYKRIIEGAIMACDQPISIEQLIRLFDPGSAPSQQELKQVINAIAIDYQSRGIELKQVASGYRFQVCQDLSPWIQKLCQERPPKHSRAFLEVLALIVYRQPITRSEIEEIRGVAVSANIIKTLTERDWIKIVGHKEVPGRPALYATTKQFLDDLNVTSLSALPVMPKIEEDQGLPLQQEIELL